MTPPLPHPSALVQVNFHDERTALVGEPHTIRVPRDAVMGDVLEELRKRLPPEHASKRLRLLEVHQSRIYKVCDPAADVGAVNAEYWTLRAEPVPDDEAVDDAEPDDAAGVLELLLLLPQAASARAPATTSVATFRPLNKGGLLPCAPASVPAR